MQYNPNISLSAPGGGSDTSPIAITVNAPQPPVLSSPTSDADGNSQGIISVQVNKPGGTLFAITSTVQAAPDNPEDIVAGLDAAGNSAVHHTSKPVEGSVVNIYPSGLNGATVYYTHIVVRQNNLFSNIASTSFETETDVQQPYPGPIPTVGNDGSITILARNYDTGGEGVAYHEVTPGIQNGATDGGRTGSSVDITEQGNLGWVSSGEWVEYTFAISASGDYKVTALLSAIESGHTFDFHLYDRNAADPSYGFTGLNVPNTGSYGTFQQVEVGTMNLDAGEYTARFYFHDNDNDLKSFTVAGIVQVSQVTYLQGWNGTTYGSERPLNGAVTPGRYVGIGWMMDSSNNFFKFFKVGGTDLQFFSDTYLSVVPGIAIYFGDVPNPTADSFEIDPNGGSASIVGDAIRVPSTATLHECSAADATGSAQFLAEVEAGDIIFVPVITGASVDPAATFTIDGGFTLVPGSLRTMDTGNRVALFRGPVEAAVASRTINITCSDATTNVRLEPIIVRP